jgi:hypothetical protein
MSGMAAGTCLRCDLLSVVAVRELFVCLSGSGPLLASRDAVLPPYPPPIVHALAANGACWRLDSTPTCKFGKTPWPPRRRTRTCGTSCLAAG